MTKILCCVCASFCLKLKMFFNRMNGASMVLPNLAFHKSDIKMKFGITAVLHPNKQIYLYSKWFGNCVLQNGEIRFLEASAKFSVNLKK